MAPLEEKQQQEAFARRRAQKEVARRATAELEGAGKMRELEDRRWEHEQKLLMERRWLGQEKICVHALHKKSGSRIRRKDCDAL